MLVINYVWQLPALSNRNTAIRTVLGGWQWSTLANVKTGEPVTVGLGVYANAGEIDGPERPNQIGKATDYKGPVSYTHLDVYKRQALIRRTMFDQGSGASYKCRFNRGPSR